MKKILVVDDEVDLLETTAAILAGGGHEVIKATNGKDAVRIARESKPDLILLDIKMPGLTGVQTTDILHSSEATRSIPIIYLSCLVKESDVADSHVTGSRIGDIQFIPKTMRPEVVLDIVNKKLNS